VFALEERVSDFGYDRRVWAVVLEIDYPLAVQIRGGEIRGRRGLPDETQGEEEGNH
jgi:hypothetical protein